MGEGRVYPIMVGNRAGTVQAVQRWGGIDDDGIVGPVTWSVLLRVH